MRDQHGIEFHRLAFLAALFGVAAASSRGANTRLFRVAVIASVAVGVITSHGMAALYARSPLGSGEYYLERYGLIATYTRR